MRRLSRVSLDCCLGRRLDSPSNFARIVQAIQKRLLGCVTPIPAVTAWHSLFPSSCTRSRVGAPRGSTNPIASAPGPFRVWCAHLRVDAKENVTLRARRNGIGSPGAAPSYPVVHRRALPLWRWAAIVAQYPPIAIQRCSHLAEPLCAQSAPVRELVLSIPTPRCDHRQHQNPARAQPVVISARIVLTHRFGRVGNVELDRPAATRLEIYEQQPLLRPEQIAWVWLAV